MKRVFRFWKILIIDLIGVACIIAAPLTGWLPGPGGIPLFILGLSLIAIHHDWGQKYIDTAQEYAHRVGELIFIKNPVVQAAYDVTVVVFLVFGAFFLLRHSALWQISLGTFLSFMGLTIFFGNRQRWHWIKANFKRKH